MASTLPASVLAPANAVDFGPWNPGIVSPVPRHLRPLETLFRPENVFTRPRDAEELADLTGMPLPQLVAFRPERLALHELLVRITAEISVPDGTKIEDLGINFREMTRTVFGRYVEPQMPAIVDTYERQRAAIRTRVEARTAELFDLRATAGTSDAVPARRGWFRWRRAGAPAPARPSSFTESIVALEQRAHHAEDPIERTACGALVRVISSVLTRHETVHGYRDPIVALATDLACNALGSDTIGSVLDPLIVNAAEREGYGRLPRQSQPVVMNTKGPSAAGKSTLRPLQRALAGRIGVDWTQFALISPDIWRKQLLDYGSLGAEYRYGGAFTGDELAIIDHKLDRYMARKAERGGMSHLLIDRFRFDSFAPDSDEAGSNLLTRFGRIIYMFFLVTPPASLVERAWNRGLDVGRYKTVDDVLAHSIEAYAGMPELFYTWIEKRDKRVHFEFLDNSVPFGDPPRTIAFGWNDALTVLDIAGMLDIERFRRVNIDATSPSALYPDVGVLAPERNTGFLEQSIQRFRQVDFAEQTSGRIYLRIASGRATAADAETLGRVCIHPDFRAAVARIAPAAFETGRLAPLTAHIGDDERIHTVGAWGRATI